MNLVFYGGGDPRELKKIDKQMLSIFPKNKNIKMTFIPSCSFFGHEDYIDFVKQYKKFNIHKIIKFDVDRPYSDVMCEQIFKSDIIHLGGGNTFYFLKYLRKNNFLKKLQQWVKDGGVLTGLSAGAIIMTANITTASFPHFDCDENEVKLKNYKGMNLVKFEFFPHYRNSKRYDAELLSYSKKTTRPIYACPDGSGIISNKDQIKFIGKAVCFYQGKKISLK